MKTLKDKTCLYIEFTLHTIITCARTIILMVCLMTNEIIVSA